MLLEPYLAARRLGYEVRGGTGVGASNIQGREMGARRPEAVVDGKRSGASRSLVGGYSKMRYRPIEVLEAPSIGIGEFDELRFG